MTSSPSNRISVPAPGRFFVLFTASLLLLLNSGCTTQTEVSQVATPAKDGKLSYFVGQKVDLKGRWNPDGKFGPYITVGKEQVYLESRHQTGLTELNSLCERFASYDGRVVRFSGTLHHQDYLPSPKPYVSAVPDYYFMDASEVEVSLSH